MFPKYEMHYIAKPDIMLFPNCPCYSSAFCMKYLFGCTNLYVFHLIPTRQNQSVLKTHFNMYVTRLSVVRTKTGQLQQIQWQS